MPAELLKIHPVNPEMRKVKHVVEILSKGGIVVYPTDTIYGVGCNLFHKKAIERLCQLLESLRQLGLTYREIEEAGVMMPVLENRSRYLAPARYDDLLRVVTTLRDKPGVRIKFEYEIYNGQNNLIHQGETVLVFINKATNRPCRQPAAMEKALERFFG